MVSALLRHAGLRASLAPACVVLPPPHARPHTGAAATPPPLPGRSAEPPLDGDKIRTRFVIGLDKPVRFHVSSLPNPNRVVVEIADSGLRLPAQPEGKPAGLVSSFRGGLAGAGQSKIVIDVTQPVVVENTKLEKSPDGRGYQLALQIVPADSEPKAAQRKALPEPSGLGAAGVQPPLPKPAQRPDAKSSKAFRPIIVLDPGHGGHDSGAMKYGTVEKDVVLAFAKGLRAKLEATGQYKVLMTRESDVFVELDERRAFGERNKANLFIAIHADYATTQARGATIYSLRDSVAQELKRSAKDEVAETVLTSSDVANLKKASGDVDTVKSILGDLAQREVEATHERTTVFTRSVIEKMGSSTNMRDDPDQQAAFRVLKTAQFPSVLIELAYVSNRQDASNLKSNEWRDKVAQSIVKAVDNYFSHQLARLPM
jgi:N-acetylmuramoyl-L-alanine amidase